MKRINTENNSAYEAHRAYNRNCLNSPRLLNSHLIFKCYILFKDSGTDIEKTVCRKVLFMMRYASFRHYWSYPAGGIWKNAKLSINTTAVLAGNDRFLAKNITQNRKIHCSSKANDNLIK